MPASNNVMKETQALQPVWSITMKEAGKETQTWHLYSVPNNAIAPICVIWLICEIPVQTIIHHHQRARKDARFGRLYNGHTTTVIVHTSVVIGHTTTVIGHTRADNCNKSTVNCHKSTVSGHTKRGRLLQWAGMQRITAARTGTPGNTLHKYAERV
jgi:hypothetical protein